MLDQERTAGAVRSAPPVSASAPHFASLSDLIAGSPDVERFCRRFYVGADASRKVDIGRQLLEALNGGTLLRGQRVQAFSLERLEAKCREVLDEGVRDDNKAIVVLLAKLADTSDGSAPGAVAATQETAERLTDEGAQRLREQQIQEYLDKHSSRREELEREAERRFPGAALMHTTWIYQQVTDLLSRAAEE